MSIFFERPKTRTRTTRLTVLTLVIAAGSGTGVRAAQTATPPASGVPAKATLPAKDSAKAPERATVRSASDPAGALGYKIAPADILQVNVWKEPDLTKDFEVRLDGMITLPLVGDLLAAGRTPSQLAESLTKALEHLIDAPRVTVGVRTNSARFYVVGQVLKSGEFPLTGRTTVVQGLALAGGFKEFAKTEGIVIIRQDQTVVSVNYKRIADGKEVSQNVVLTPGDTVVVP